MGGFECAMERIQGQLEIDGVIFRGRLDGVCAEDAFLQQKEEQGA
jgi:hypothetical protein